MMKILISPQAFKGSLSAFEVADAMKIGVQRVYPDAQVVEAPVADGGDGTLDVLSRAMDAERRKGDVTGPLGRRVGAEWGWVADLGLAIIEMGKVCGLALGERDPLLATTYGLGELIRQGLDGGVRRFFIGLGGSATNDGGMGMAQALGVRFLDHEGKELGRGGGELLRLEHVDISGMDKRVQDVEWTIACDVSNPLTGPLGASRIYAPQKGASPDEVVLLEKAMVRFADVVQRDLGIELHRVPLAGAAGGMAAGLKAFFGAELQLGSDVVLEMLKWEKLLAGTSLVLTGEGRWDQQTEWGKAPMAVATRAKQHGIPVIAIVGSVGEKGKEAGIEDVIPLTFSQDAQILPNSGALVASATELGLRRFKDKEKK